MKRGSLPFLLLAMLCWLLSACAFKPTPTGLPSSTPSAAATALRLTPTASPTPLPPTRIQADHCAALFRSGQTFITWDERADLSGERYRIYRHSAPISAATLAAATRLAEVPEGSALFYANRYNRASSVDWQYRYLERLVITARGNPLPEGTGLLAWTLAAEDFAGSPAGAGYYAVTVLPAGGAETLAAGYSLGPLSEGQADPLPVEIAVDAGPGGHIYIQYMDLHSWNPTFHAPNSLNAYYGLDPAAPAVAGALQYAYDYAVYAPTPEQCGGALPANLPVFVSLHGWAGNSYPPFTQPPDPYWCAYAIYPLDVGETWWFGFARQQDYRQSQSPGAGDVIVNYTEQRLLRMVADLLRQPPGPPVDPQRIYVYGHSMGGGGALALALRYPDVFAAAYASEPMTNYRTSAWQAEVARKWGSQELNLPVLSTAPADWAAGLQPYNGEGVWDWQDHQANLGAARRPARLGDNMVPFGVAHGSRDTVIEWATQGEPAYPAFNAARRAWGGAIVDADHTWLGFQGLPPTMGVVAGAPFANFQVVRSESVPGFSNASANSALPPTGPGAYNQTLRWSSSWDPWDGPPVDTPTRWQISLCAVATDPAANACGSGLTQTVDITARRLQNFIVIPGAQYLWANQRISDNLVANAGTISADPSGVVTVPGFEVSPAGNRLILQFITDPSQAEAYLPFTIQGHLASPTPAPSPTSAATPTAIPTVTITPATGGAPRPWPDTSWGIHVFNDQLPSWMSSAQWEFAATHYDGTQKMTRPDADRLRAINPNLLILHYRLGQSLGYREIEDECQPSGDWIRIVEGDAWVREWPSNGNIKEDWFFHWPVDSEARVLNCDWGWYLAELDDPGWRRYWQAEVLWQVEANAADGVFMDSLSVPSFLGPQRFEPVLPRTDETFETDWSDRIQDWLAWLQLRSLGAYYLVPNVGNWITSRDRTDYSAADGVMIEGFALDSDGNPYYLADWQLQMNRALSLIDQDKAILAQTTAVTGSQERLFALGSYLLIKGSRTYLNIELGLEPEWWPEYDIPLGPPVESAGTDIDTLYDPAMQLYRRDFSNGLVLVNPTTRLDDTGRTVALSLGSTYYLVQPAGGGLLPDNAVPSGTISYEKVDSLTLQPFSAAVLLSDLP